MKDGWYEMDMKLFHYRVTSDNVQILKDLRGCPSTGRPKKCNPPLFSVYFQNRLSNIKNGFMVT